MKYFFFTCFCFLVVTACQSTQAVTTKTLSPVELSQKRLLIISYDSPLAKDFVISFKNYLAKDLAEHGVLTDKINILSDNKVQSTQEAEALKHRFSPDYILEINITQERGRKMPTLKTVRELRELTLSLQLSPTQSPSDVKWSAQAHVNHIFDTDQISIVRSLSKNIILKMQKDMIIK